MTMKIKRSKAKILNSKGKERIKEKTKKEKVLIIEAKETILKIKNTTTHIIIAIRKPAVKEGNTRQSPAIAPKLVDTPLPPLNFKKGVQL